MQLYFAPLACSMATRIALYEAGAAADFIEVDTREKRIVGDDGDYRAINPLGQVPVLRLEDGRLLTENTAILQYVARLYPEAGLTGAADDLPWLQHWLSFVSTELHKQVYTPLLSPRSSEAEKTSARDSSGIRFDKLERHLAGREFLLDRFTVADAYLAIVLNWSGAAGLDLTPWPELRTYHKRMLGRPSVARALREERQLYAAEQARRAA